MNLFLRDKGLTRKEVFAIMRVILFALLVLVAQGRGGFSRKGRDLIMNENNACVLYLDTNNPDGHMTISAVFAVKGLSHRFELLRIDGNNVAEMERMRFQWSRLADALTDTVPVTAEEKKSEAMKPTHVLDDPWTLRNIEKGDLLVLNLAEAGRAILQIVEPSGEIMNIAAEGEGFNFDQLHDTFKRQARAYGLDVDAKIQENLGQSSE